MKNIEIDEELYQYIAANTQYIGESASSILRRLLAFTPQDIKDPVLAESNTPLVESPASKASVSVDDTEQTDSIIAEEALPTDNLADTLEGEVDITPSSDTNTNVFNYINKEEMAMQRGAVGRFLLILAALYRVHGEQFSVVYEIRGRDRLYFADTEAALEQSGSSTKPRQIPDSPFWVITNSNTTRKKMMLTEASKSLGYSEEEVEKIRDLL